MSETVSFMKGARRHGWERNLADDPTMKCLATCIVSQQAAGFKTKRGPLVDLRQMACPTCGSPGFNTGWGYFLFSCGEEVLSDGEARRQCSSTEPRT